MARPFHIILPLLLLTAFACVPRTQYDALTTERDAYRREVLGADSAANARLLAATDSLQLAREARQRQARRIDELTAANATLTERVADLTQRYESILEQNRNLVADGGADDDLRQRLLDRAAELDNRQAEIDRLRRELALREENLASLDRMRAGQPDTDLTARGTSPVDPDTDQTVRMAKLSEEVRQVLQGVAESGFALARDENNNLAITLGGSFAFNEAGDSLSLTGQRAVRRLAATLRNYPGLEYTILGHAESGGEDALAAYRASTERAARIATRLAESGMDPGTLIAAGVGFYATDTDAPLSGLDAARRTTIIVRPRAGN